MECHHNKIAMKSLYSILDVPQTASYVDIQYATKRALSAITDEKISANPELKNRLIAIQEAHRVLSSETLRAEYDKKLQPQVVYQPIYSPEPEAINWKRWVFILLGLMLLMAYHFNKVQKEKNAVENALRDKARLDQQIAIQRRAEAEAARKPAEEFQQEQRRLAWEREKAIRAAQNLSFSVDRGRPPPSYNQPRQQDQIRYEDLQKERRMREEAEILKYKEKKMLYDLCMQRYNRPDC